MFEAAEEIQLETNQAPESLALRKTESSCGSASRDASPHQNVSTQEKIIMSVTIYHNPKCSKSRQTLELLEQQGITPTVIEYLKTPPDAATLKEILARLKLTPRELMRKKETTYDECGIDNPALSEDDLIALMTQHPILIERPIVLANGKAALGRPPEQVLEIL